MPRLPMVPAEPADPKLKELFDGVRARGIEVPDLYRVLGNAPKLFEAWLAFAWPLRLEATTPRALRELIIMRGAQLSGADYEWVHHWPMALEAGLTEDKLQGLPDWRTSEIYTEQERACLRMVDEVNQLDGASAVAMEDLRRLFDDAEVVELVLTASFYVCVGRFLKSMDIAPEEAFVKYLPKL